MKNVIFIIFILIICSCSKNLDKSNSFIINGNEIEVQENLLKFNDLSSFYQIVNDYYDNEEIYLEYFLNYRPIENSIISYEDFLDVFESTNWNSKEEVLAYIENHTKGVKYENSEFKNLFVMDYKNLFCNLEGMIRIGDYLYKYDDKGRYKQYISDGSLDFNIENAKYEIMNIQVRNDVVNLRSDFGGGCQDEVSNKRISCTDALDFDFFESPGCILPFSFNPEFIAEAKIKFQRSTWFGWINSRADRLRVDIYFDAFDQNGINVLQIDDFRESTNAYSTKWGSVDSFCAECDLNYSFTDYEFDFLGEFGNTTYACDNDLFLNVNDTNLCQN